MHIFIMFLNTGYAQYPLQHSQIIFFLLKAMQVSPVNSILCRIPDHFLIIWFHSYHARLCHFPKPSKIIFLKWGLACVWIIYMYLHSGQHPISFLTPTWYFVQLIAMLVPSVHFVPHFGHFLQVTCTLILFFFLLVCQNHMSDYVSHVHMCFHICQCP